MEVEAPIAGALIIGGATLVGTAPAVGWMMVGAGVVLVVGSLAN